MEDEKAQRQANVTLDQLCVVAAYERLMAHCGMEATLLRTLRKPNEAEQLESTMRHLGKHRDTYLAACQSRILIAPVNAVPGLDKTH